MRRNLMILALALCIGYGCATPGPKEPKAAPPSPQGAKILEAQAAVAQDSANPELQYRFGNALFDAGRYAEARRAYEQAVALKPDYAAALCNLGLCLRLLGQTSDAIAAYTRALELEPNDETTLTNLIAAHRALGEHDETIPLLRRLAELRPQDVLVRSELANILFRNGDYAGAEAVFKEVIELDPGMSSDYYNLGLCYLELGNLDEALTTWLTALAYDPNNISVRKGLAVLYWKRGEYEKAWQAVVDCQTRNIPLDPEFMARLQDDSGQIGPDTPK